MQLHAERLEGGDEVEGERVSLLPEAYQQANSDSSQNHGLSDHLVNKRPVPTTQPLETDTVLQYKGSDAHTACFSHLSY